MVGTRRKRSKSNSKALNFVPEDPGPLNIINVEAADSPKVELVKNDVLNSDNVPAYIVENEEERMAHEMNDVQEAIGFEINDTTIDRNDTVYTEPYTEEEDQMTDETNDEEEATGIEINDKTVDGSEAVLTELYTEEQDDFSDGDDEVTNVHFENSNEKKNDGGSEKDTSDIGDEKETEENQEFCFPCDSANEDVCSGEEDGEEVEDSEEVEEDGEEVEEDIEEDGEEVEEVEEDEVESEGEEVEEDDEEEVELEEDDEVDEEDRLEEEEEEGEEEGEEEDVSDGGDESTNRHVENKYERTNEEEAPNTYESLTAPVQVLMENTNDDLDSDKEENALTPKDPIIIEIASTCNTITIVPEKVILPEKGIARKKLFKKKLVSKVCTSNEVKSQHSEDNEAIGEAIEGDETENVKTKEVKGNIVVKVNKKLNRIRKKKPPGQSGLQIGNVEQNPKPTCDEPVCMNNQSIEEELRKEEVKKAKARLLRLNKEKNKKVVEEGAEKVNMVDIDKPESSKSARSSKKIDSMGMIFMCSSRTKKDCYRYNIFGLPASKKDVVSKIYKGMRLFLYDIDLKLLYGIYKAAGPGGYNVEPEAFKSQFPSQVRFTVLSDCLPLTEEKFKRVIKDNYYTKNKFSCQLTSDQVKNLCKLFRDSTNRSDSKRPGLSHRPNAISSTRVDLKRKRAEDSRRVGPSTIPLLEHERKRKRPDEVRRPPRVRRQERLRRSPVIINERRHRRPDVYDYRESYLPRVESSALYQPLRGEDSRIYSYVRDPEVDSYRRGPAIIDYPDLEIPGPREVRHHVRQNINEPYVVSYREPQVYYREPVYESDTRREHYAEYYRSDDYRSPLTRHRRY